MEAYLTQADLNDLQMQNAVKDLLLSVSSPAEAKIILVSFSTYVANEKKEVYIPAELGLTVFSVREGILDNYWTLVDSKQLPNGWALEALDSVKKLEIPRPPFSERFQDYLTIVENINAVLEKYKHSKSGRPILVCLDKERNTTLGCFKWLYNWTGTEPSIKLVSLELLVPRLSAIAVACRAKRENQLFGDVLGKLLNENCYYEERSEDIRVRFSTLRSNVWKSTPSDKNLKFCVKSFTHPTIKDGILTDDRVEALFESFDLTDLACLYHTPLQEDDEDNNNCEVEAQMVNGNYLCPLNITNQRAYFILSVLVANFDISPVKDQHYFDWDDRASSLKRRKELLAKWGINYESSNVFSLPNSIPIVPEW